MNKQEEHAEWNKMACNNHFFPRALTLKRKIWNYLMYTLCST